MSDEIQSPNAPIREGADGCHPLSPEQLSAFSVSHLLYWT